MFSEDGNTRRANYPPWALIRNWLPRRLAFTPDQIRLLASLGFNFIGKAPGIVAAFVILPLVSRSLGTAMYGELLSAMALGSVFSLPFGGIYAVGRRLLGSAYGAKDKARQANAFVSTTWLSTIIAILASIVMVTVTRHSWSQPIFIFVSLTPVLVAFFNGFDNTRASYNEHYVTAGFQLISQSAIYAGVYFAGLPQGSIGDAALTLQSPFVLASAATLIVLLVQRPYLLRGKIRGSAQMLVPALGVVMADGALAVLLNLSVYWLKVAGNAEMAAWVGTFVRLFQSFLSPVLLILFPLATYISMRWSNMAPQRRHYFYRIFILTGLAYGLIVGAAIAFAGPFYINHMFKLTSHGDNIDVLALSVFLGAIIAQKTYTMLLYAVSEARFVSYGTAVISALGVAVALTFSHWLSSMRVIDVLFICTGVGLPLLLLFGHQRYTRARQQAPEPSV
jgi:hypothetical protein